MHFVVVVPGLKHGYRSNWDEMAHAIQRFFMSISSFSFCLLDFVWLYETSFFFQLPSIRLYHSVYQMLLFWRKSIWITRITCYGNKIENNDGMANAENPRKPRIFRAEKKKLIISIIVFLLHTSHLTLYWTINNNIFPRLFYGFGLCIDRYKRNDLVKVEQHLFWTKNFRQISYRSWCSIIKDSVR